MTPSSGLASWEPDAHGWLFGFFFPASAMTNKNKEKQRTTWKAARSCQGLRCGLALIFLKPCHWTKNHVVGLELALFQHPAMILKSNILNPAGKNRDMFALALFGVHVHQCKPTV